MSVELLDELDEWLDENEIEPRVVWSPRVKNKDVARAARALGVRLPPSYVELVTTRGTFFIDGDLTGRGSGNDTRLLTPSEIVEHTERYRGEAHEHDGPEQQRILDDALIFCADPKGELFHLFVISSLDDAGEMATRPYDYQNLGMNDGWHEGDGSFASVIEGIVADVEENLVED